MAKQDEPAERQWFSGGAVQIRLLNGGANGKAAISRGEDKKSRGGRRERKKMSFEWKKNNQHAIWEDREREEEAHVTCLNVGF
jgi:hypothetical protein